jgi:hypothetical protein
MATFPRTEPTVLALVQEMITGLTANATTFPNLPVPVSGTPLIPNLTLMTSNYTTARDAAMTAQAAAEQATTTKNAALETLIEAMKKDLRYAETTTSFNDDLLKKIGWSGRKTPQELVAPGQCRTLEAPRQGEGWVFLDWKEPIDGGKPAAYKIQRRERPAGDWQDVSTAMDSETTLVDQPRGKELEYRAVAVNKTGDGEASNTVLAVL